MKSSYPMLDGTPPRHQMACMIAVAISVALIVLMPASPPHRSQTAIATQAATPRPEVYSGQSHLGQAQSQPRTKGDTMSTQIARETTGNVPISQNSTDWQNNSAIPTNDWAINKDGALVAYTTQPNGWGLPANTAAYSNPSQPVTVPADAAPGAYTLSNQNSPRAGGAFSVPGNPQVKKGGSATAVTLSENSSIPGVTNPPSGYFSVWEGSTQVVPDTQFLGQTDANGNYTLTVNGLTFVFSYGSQVSQVSLQAAANTTVPDYIGAFVIVHAQSQTAGSFDVVEAPSAPPAVSDSGRILRPQSQTW